MSRHTLRRWFADPAAVPARDLVRRETADPDTVPLPRRELLDVDGGRPLHELDYIRRQTELADLAEAEQWRTPGSAPVTELTEWERDVLAQAEATGGAR